MTTMPSTSDHDLLKGRGVIGARAADVGATRVGGTTTEGVADVGATRVGELTNAGVAAAGERVGGLTNAGVNGEDATVERGAFEVDGTRSSEGIIHVSDLPSPDVGIRATSSSSLAVEPASLWFSNFCLARITD